ncbi:MAG TPA: ribonuclease J [Patescibacteria group bacterium]|nr:ribonuclease J [Patescibacteria group bacterium]
MAGVRFISLGGIGDVTKNMYVYETDRDILIVDCGIGFPDQEMPGIDLLLPDSSYLVGKESKIRGIVLTHGHEDHIGALPYLLPKLQNPPVFATSLTIALVAVKLDEVGIGGVKLHTVSEDEVLKLGDFQVSFFHVSHSVPDAAGLIISTPDGRFIHTGDYKFDWTPVDGRWTQVQKIALAGKEGVLALFSDCVRIEKEGYTLSERVISEGFSREFERSKGRVLITTFSSNISRIQQAIDVSEKFGRKVALVGRSIESNARVAKALGYLKYGKKVEISIDQIDHVPNDKLTLIVAGSQAQADSALTRIAHGGHKKVRIEPEDVVIFASDPVPGNENQVHTLIDSLSRQGAKVIYSNITDDVHVSGHASREELRLMIALSTPKYLIPVSSDFRHMQLYQQMAQEMGYPKERIFLLRAGDLMEFKDGKLQFLEKIRLQNIMIDGIGGDDVEEVVLRDRQLMSEEGIIVVIIPFDAANGRVVGEIDIIPRGFPQVSEKPTLFSQAKNLVETQLQNQKAHTTDQAYLKKTIGKALEKHFYHETERKPLILPVIIEV